MKLQLVYPNDIQQYPNETKNSDWKQFCLSKETV